MEKPTNIEQFSKLLLYKFLIHFVPGVILFFGLLAVSNSHMERGLLASVIVISFSWLLGLILEILCFRKKYQLRIDDEFDQKNFIHYLLISKTGLALLFGVGVNAIIGVLDLLNASIGLNLELVIILAVKTVIFGGLGLILFLFFRKAPKN